MKPDRFVANSQRKKHLLLILAPTPNGRLHLGHVAGPFLRVDVLARHLRRRGDRVCVIGGTDAYESYVTLAAHNERLSAAEICHRNHPLIHNDLNALDITTDLFINPLDERWREPYAQTYRAVLQRLLDGGHVRHINEQISYCRASSRYIVGCWLLGNCPNCQQPAGSYLCELCGYHFRPEELTQAQSRLDEGTLETLTVESLFAQVPDVEKLRTVIRLAGTSPTALRAVTEQYLSCKEALIRLTNPGDWGVPWTVDPNGVPRVVFSYAGLYAYTLFCGAQYAASYDTAVGNAFDIDSGVNTVLTYGIDNAIPMQLGVLGAALADGAYKPVDALLGCYFYHLEGEKFSTSRRHIIWAADIVDKTPVGSDAVRYYLAQTNPEAAPTNFDIGEFVAVVNGQLAGRLEEQVQQAAADAVPSGPPADALLRRLDELLHAQDQAMNQREFSLAGMLPPLNAWIDASMYASINDANARYWWLKALALLAYPVMPRMANKIWRALGSNDDYPTVETFMQASQGSAALQLARSFTPVTVSDLKPCLPTTVRH